MSHPGYRAVLVLGGIRSGKSEYAESLVSTAAEVRYVATAAPAGDDDPEWAARLAAHRERRPAAWQTDEVGAEPGRLAALLAETKPDQTVLVDDLGGWMAALLDRGETGYKAGDKAGDEAGDEVHKVAEAVRDCAGRVVVVSPEVGLSVVPATEAGRAFADALGSANRALAEACDAVVLVVAGQPTWLKRGVPGARMAPVAARPVAAPATIVTATLEADAGELPIGPGQTLPIPDQEASGQAAERVAGLDVRLGALADVVAFAAGAQGTAVPQPFQAVRVLLIQGAHEGGIATGDETEAWTRRFNEVAGGGGPLGLLAGQAGAALQLVDTAAAGFPAAGPVEVGDAVPAAELDTALRYGYRLAESAADSGTDLLVLAAGGPGQETAAVAVISATTGAEAPAMLPPVRVAGGRYDDNAWMVRCATVRDALHRTRGTARQPKELLAALGGADLAIAAGVVLGAAARRTPVLIDGPVAVAAALVARDLAIESRLWLLLADHGGHPAVVSGADVLGVAAVAELKLGLGEGAAALAVLPLIQSALLLSTADSA
jgi:adenosyl cobinamide kinase/adenosyl cobinamide phosphate guanylyltransferase/NaMN:DMB phosphoribosyltransferase